MQWHTIDKHHRARGLEHIRAAHANNAVGIADKALAHNQAGFMGQGIFNRSDTDGL